MDIYICVRKSWQINLPTTLLKPFSDAMESYKFMTCCYAELSGNFEELLCNELHILVEILGVGEILNLENLITCAGSRV
mgnify:FL=1